MSWRDRLQTGQFRDAAFFTESHEAGGGRRLALNEYPLRDEPYAEDLGRRAREFTIDCYVLASQVIGGERGDDYMAARDRLIQKLEQPGPGLLVHPYLGTRSVIAREYRLRETTRDGGMATFSITFVEAGRPAEPDTVSDTRTSVGNAADAAQAAIQAEFEVSFSVEDMPDFVSSSATDILEDAITDIRQISGRIASVTSPITQFSAQLDRLGDSLSSLIRQPANLAADVAGVVVAIAGVAKDVQTGLAAYRRLWLFGDDRSPVPTTTAARQQQSVNQTALTGLIQRTATIEACRASSNMSYASHDEAAALREELADQLDALMETAADAVYAALVDLRVAVVKDITQRGADLARLVSYTPATTLPALVIAHALYEDATRDAEIVARNRIRHPGFVPGGTALKVLTDA